MDAGGHAQMAFNNFPSNNSFGNTNSFASRGKGAHIKRLSVAPPNMGPINENEVDNHPAPRTSRAHMLSGLRTAKINTNVGPASAPHSQTSFGNNSGSFGQNGYNQTNQQMFTPEQILAPPTMNMGNDDASQMDQQAYNNMVMTNMYLAQRQQQLQQQLMNAQAAAQQFQAMNLNGQQYGSSPLSPSSSIYHQQLQGGMQPIVQQVPNQPGLYSVYNPMTGQQSFYPESALQQSQQNLPQSPMTAGLQPESNFNRRENKSPPSAANNGWTRTLTPPRQTPSPPQDVAPLPEPSANAYRPGHRRSISSMNKTGDVKANGPRSAGIPPTPVDGTFGLGLARAGEHPIRQPRGPPALEELAAAPTSKHEGSKNFASRQRRRALFNLVRAGNERRVARPDGANGDLPTPGSESGTPFGNSSSDDESDSTPATGSLSAHSSFGSLKAAAGGAIGSEVKHLKERSRERDTFARRLTGDSNSSNDESNNNNGPERRRTPMLVLTSAEKRKSSMGFGSPFA